MTTPAARFAAGPDVVFTKLDDTEAVLLDLKTQRYFSLNETGVTVWELLAAPRTLGEIVTALTERYDVREEDAHGFADAFLRDLTRDGLARTV